MTVTKCFQCRQVAPEQVQMALVPLARSGPDSNILEKLGCFVQRTGPRFQDHCAVPGCFYANGAMLIFNIMALSCNCMVFNAK